MIEIYLETKPKGDVKECNGKEIGDRFWDVNFRFKVAQRYPTHPPKLSSRRR